MEAEAEAATASNESSATGVGAGLPVAGAGDNDGVTADRAIAISSDSHREQEPKQQQKQQQELLREKREARRRRILSSGSSRLAYITGTASSLPSPSADLPTDVSPPASVRSPPPPSRVAFDASSLLTEDIISATLRLSGESSSPYSSSSEGEEERAEGENRQRTGMRKRGNSGKVRASQRSVMAEASHFDALLGGLPRGTASSATATGTGTRPISSALQLVAKSVDASLDGTQGVRSLLAAIAAFYVVALIHFIPCRYRGESYLRDVVPVHPIYLIWAMEMTVVASSLSYGYLWKKKSQGEHKDGGGTTGERKKTTLTTGETVVGAERDVDWHDRNGESLQSVLMQMFSAVDQIGWTMDVVCTLKKLCRSVVLDASIFFVVMLTGLSFGDYYSIPFCWNDE